MTPFKRLQLIFAALSKAFVSLSGNVRMICCNQILLPVDD